jgi:hypothetical protein
MIKKGDLDKYGAKIPGTTPKEDGVVTFGNNPTETIATQPQASTSAPVTATVTEVVEVVKVDGEDKKEKKRKRKSEAAGEDGDKTVDGADGEKKKVSLFPRFTNLPQGGPLR